MPICDLFPTPRSDRDWTSLDETPMMEPGSIDPVPVSGHLGMWGASGEPGHSFAQTVWGVTYAK